MHRPYFQVGADTEAPGRHGFWGDTVPPANQPHALITPGASGAWFVWRGVLSPRSEGVRDNGRVPEEANSGSNKSPFNSSGTLRAAAGCFVCNIH